MRFVLIRHGQSGNNKIYAETGASVGRDPDTLLTDLGQAQATALGAYAAQLPWRPTHLYCSLMSRAIQTAAPLADALDLPLVGHELLHECGGPYEECVDTGLRTAHPGSGRTALATITARLQIPDVVGEHGWFAGPHEEEAAYADRAHEVVRRLREVHADTDVVALITHGWFTQYLIRELLGITTMAGWFTVHNTGISMLQDSPDPNFEGTVDAVEINWTPHLSNEQLTE